MKIESLIDDATASAVVDAIVETTRTGRIGAGRVFDSPVDDAVRIRTGGRGSNAL